MGAFVLPLDFFSNPEMRALLAQFGHSETEIDERLGGLREKMEQGLAEVDAELAKRGV